MDRSVYARMDAQEAEHWWFVARRRIIAATIERLIPLPHEARLLEAGCGTGGNLEMLQRYGALRAFEYDEHARTIAQSKSGLAVAFGALPGDVPYPDEQFDLICLFDVLEHVEDDIGSLAALGARLRPGGRILLTVPAYPWLWSHHDETHHHFRRYTRRSIAMAAGAAGLSVERSFHFNALLLPLILAVRGLKSLSGRQTADDAMPGRAINRALTGTFGAERHLVGRIPMPAGVSLCAILVGGDT